VVARLIHSWPGQLPAHAVGVFLVPLEGGGVADRIVTGSIVRSGYHTSREEIHIYDPAESLPQPLTMAEGGGGGVLSIVTFEAHDSSPFFATGHQDGGIRVWEGRTREVIFTLYGHSGPVRHLAAYEDLLEGSTRLLSGGGDGAIWLWNCREGSGLRELGRLDGEVEALLTYLSAGRHQRVVAGSARGQLSVFDADTGEVRALVMMA
jgi:WD40 repeat protein